MSGTVRLGSVGGIAVGIHYTWLAAFALIAFTLATSLFPDLHPGLEAGTYWAMGVVAALGLFGSVLLHELSHSFMAKARGLEVEGITLFIFGGVSNIKAESENPKDEFLVAVVGPLSSLVLAGAFFALGRVLPGEGSPASALLGYLALANLLLALFNLVPGFPLDGGRVLRSALWAALQSYQRATTIASAVGQVVAFLLAGYGVVLIFSGQFFGGLWTVLIGWFLNNAAELSRAQARFREGFRGVRVRDVMRVNYDTVPPYLPVSDLVYDYVIGRGQRALPVIRDNEIIGIVTITDVKRLPSVEWAQHRVSEIMTPTPLKTIGPEADVQLALRLLTELDVNQLLVVEEERLIGVLGRGDVLRFLQLREELRFDRKPGASAPGRRGA